MPSISGPCDVCLDNASKYRCPMCVISYCSLSCYKVHKDKCKSTEPQGTDSATDCDRAEKTTNKPAEEKEEGELSDDDEREEMMADVEDEDRVPSERLQQLGNSEEVKSLLHNPHLRQVLSHLDQTDNKEKAIADAMQEPLFIEFADQCLQIVEENNEGT